MLPPQTEYLVIIRARQTPLVGVGMSGVTIANTGNGIRLKTVDADGPQEAAEKAGVRPGETVTVVPAIHVHSFKRPEEAPLVAA